MTNYRLSAFGANGAVSYGASRTVRCYDEAALEKAIERFRNDFAVDHSLNLNVVAVKSEPLG